MLKFLSDNVANSAFDSDLDSDHCLMIGLDVNN